MRRILAISLTLLLLITNSGIALSAHYCGGHLMMTKVSLGNEHLECGMGNMDSDCEIPISRHSVKAESCCSNEHFNIEVDDQYSSELKELKVSPIFLTALLHSIISDQFISDQNNTGQSEYLPPIVEQDIQALFQSFLI